MADHVEQQLIDAVAALVTGLSATGSRVFTDYDYSFSPSDLPCLSITSPNENAGYLTIHGPRHETSKAILVIDAIHQSSTSVTRKLREIRKEVQSVLASNRKVGGLAKAFKRIGSDMQIDTSGAQPVGICRMTFEFEIHYLETTPDVAL